MLATMHFALSRHDDPVAYDAQLGQWFVSSYDDVRALMVDERLTADRMCGFVERAPAEAVAEVRSAAPWLISSQGADYSWIGPLVHAGLRGTAGPGFKERIVRAADELIDGVMERERFDVVGDYAFALSGCMLADLLGIEPGDARPLLEWGLDVVAFFNSPELTIEGAGRLAHGTGALVGHVHELLADRRTRAIEGFLGLVARAAESRGQALDDEAIGSVALPLVTGHVDAAHLAATAIWLLLAHGDQRARLASDARLLGGAVAEALRFGSPVALVPRTALEPVAVHGHVIRRGERAQLSIAAASRDPTRFPDPDRFDIGRAQSGALGFGHGARSCVAAGLARTYVAVAVDTLLRRAPDLGFDVDGEITWWTIPGVQALQSFDVRATPATARPRP
jgi:cytochrome P450